MGGLVERARKTSGRRGLPPAIAGAVVAPERPVSGQLFFAESYPGRSRSSPQLAAEPYPQHRENGRLFPFVSSEEGVCMDDKIFLKLDGIVGASKDEQHPYEIEIVSWSWGKGYRSLGVSEKYTPNAPKSNTMQISRVTDMR